MGALSLMNTVNLDAKNSSILMIGEQLKSDLLPYSEVFFNLNNKLFLQQLYELQQHTIS